MSSPSRRTPDLTDPVTAAVRALAMDMVENAKSGHPGAPLGLAEIASVLWRRYLRHDPANPAWPDRDRFVLSNGHASPLLYALLHLTGYRPAGRGAQALPPACIPRRRAIRNSASPLGVETTTGPLGQGFANAVGMAIAEKTLGRAVQPARPRQSSTTAPTWSSATAA